MFSGDNGISTRSDHHGRRRRHFRPPAPARLLLLEGTSSSDRRPGRGRAGPTEVTPRRTRTSADTEFTGGGSLRSGRADVINLASVGRSRVPWDGVDDHETLGCDVRRSLPLEVSLRVDCLVHRSWGSTKVSTLSVFVGAEGPSSFQCPEDCVAEGPGPSPGSLHVLGFGRRRKCQKQGGRFVNVTGCSGPSLGTHEPHQ